MPSLSTPPSKPLKSVLHASALYPFKGIYFFLAHPEYYPLFGRRLIPLTIISIVVLGLLFAFTYLPQVAFLLIFHGPTAWVSGVFLVLGEGQVVIALLFEALLVDETLVDVFDATLIHKNLQSLVSPSRLIDPSSPNVVKSLRKPTSSAIYSPFSFRQIFEFTIFLPLNLIPIIGVPFFLLLTGARAGPLHHYRYFKLRGLSRKEKSREIHSRRWKYTWFGTVALCLQLVPVLSMFFLLTTACGSALWVGELEEEKRRIASLAIGAEGSAGIGAQEEGIISTEGRIGEGDEPPPSYTDNPV